MLTGASPVPSQRPAASPSTPTRARDAKPDHGSPAAERFREKLQALAKEKSEHPKALRKAENPQPEGAAQAMPPIKPADTPLGRTKQTENGNVEAAGTGATPTTEHRAAAPEAGPDTVGDTFTATLSAKFAERLALTPHVVADTHLLLDAGRYTVSSVTISGQASEGMSLSYDGGSRDGEGASHDEEALRQRLEARGLKVAEIARRS